MRKSTAAVLLLSLQLLNIGAAAAPPLLDYRPPQQLEFELDRDEAHGPVVGPSVAAAKIGADTTLGTQFSAATPAPVHPVSSVFDELLSDDALFGSVKPWTTEDFFDFLTFASQDDGTMSNAIGESGDDEDEEVFRLKTSPATSTTSTEMTPGKDGDYTQSTDDGQESVGPNSTKNTTVDQTDEEAESTFADFLRGFETETTAPNSSVPIEEQKPSLLAIRVQDPEKILDILQLFERYSSLRNTSLLPSIRRKTTEMIRYSPSTLRNVASDPDTNSSYPEVSYSGVGITISDFKTNLPPLKVSRPTPSSDSSGVLEAFTNFIEDVGEAVGDFLTSVGNAFANNPVLTVLTLGALIFLLFHLLVNYTWLKKKPRHKGHGQGYHRRMDVGETFYDDAVKLQRILDVIEDYERKYGEKIFI